MQQKTQNEKRVFGRRLGRPLSPTRQEALDNLLPKLALTDAQLAQKESLRAEDLFKAAPKEFWMEIGFGSGEHLAALMRRHPDHGFIGAEPYINGMSAFFTDIENDLPHPNRHPVEKRDLDACEQGDSGFYPLGHKRWNDGFLNNIRVIMDDAMLAVEALADQTLDGIYILNPDPWHKKKHHKRRIVRAENLDQFARVLKPDGQLIMSTDVPYLAEWMVTGAINHPAFEWTANDRNDWQMAPPDWITTKYETKRAKGADKMVYLIFKKKAT